MADTSDDIYNLYKECEECGGCCELTVLAVTDEEIESIRRYMDEAEFTPRDQGPGICPFRLQDKRCGIYPVRPITCRLHNCSIPRHILDAEHPEVDIPDEVQLVDTRMTFIHGKTVDPRMMSEEWIIGQYSEQ